MKNLDIKDIAKKAKELRDITGLIIYHCGRVLTLLDGHFERSVLFVRIGGIGCWNGDKFMKRNENNEFKTLEDYIKKVKEEFPHNK